MFNSQYLPADIDFDARIDEPYPTYDVTAWVLPLRERELDADHILATYIEAQTVKTLQRYGLTLDKVNELVALLDAYLGKR